jgi:hypothetical protein
MSESFRTSIDVEATPERVFDGRRSPVSGVYAEATAGIFKGACRS